MAEHSPKHGLTKTFRKGEHAGWNKKINGRPKWICSAAVAPTGSDADKYYVEHFTELWQEMPDPASPGDITIEVLASYYDARKKRAGLDPRSYAEIILAVDEFVELVGGDRAAGSLTSFDFARVRQAWSERFGPHRLSKYIVLIRGMFKWARKPPIRLHEPDYGDEFNRPTRKQFRVAKAETRQAMGVNLFDSADLIAIFKHANERLLAMVLLGINGALGNTDVAQLPESLLDLTGGWVDYARGKTGNERRFVLWPETVTAIKEALKYRDKLLAHRIKDGRPVHAAVDKLVFITRQGRPYIEGIGSHKDRVSVDFAKLCKNSNIKTRGRGFYTLRRTFRTVADETTDQRAAARVMGHFVADIGGVYVQRISDQRLKAVTDHVRDHFAEALSVVALAQAQQLNKPSVATRTSTKLLRVQSRGKKPPRSRETNATAGETGFR